MTKSSKTFIILLILFVELAWVFWPRFYMHGRILDEPYRRDVRKATLYAWLKDRTPETKSAYDAEIKLLNERDMAILATGLVINVAGIYLLWRHVPPRTAAPRYDGM